MAVSRQSSPPGPDRAKDLALCQENFRRRLPTTLEDLHGPVTGVVELPMQGAFPVLAVRGRSAV
ncbi:hypothetical protein OHS59_01400 [Streptomyces sp. NBC_00414]|uniref:hypothetical protein n=1 Tax=Streptomyces sp. NBC_00414 TaxID=2975739 RepID=UPI002E21FE30